MNGTGKSSEIEEEIPIDIEEDEELQIHQQDDKKSPEYYECDDDYLCFGDSLGSNSS